MKLEQFASSYPSNLLCSNIFNLSVILKHCWHLPFSRRANNTPNLRCLLLGEVTKQCRSRYWIVMSVFNTVLWINAVICPWIKHSAHQVILHAAAASWYTCIERILHACWLILVQSYIAYNRSGWCTPPDPAYCMQLDDILLQIICCVQLADILPHWAPTDHVYCMLLVDILPHMIYCM